MVQLVKEKPAEKTYPKNRSFVAFLVIQKLS